MPNRASSPVCAPVIWSSRHWRICWPVRATFQMRASSMRPRKKPAAVPLELSALPSAVRWMESDRGLSGVGERQRSVEATIEVELPRTAVVRDGRVVPSVVGDHGAPGDRVVETRRGLARAFLEVGYEPARGVDAEEVVQVDVRAVRLTSDLSRSAARP